MTQDLIIALAQINPTVGDIDTNAARLRDARGKAHLAGADLVVAGELAIAGYPPEDLVLKRSFQSQIIRKVNALAEETGDGGPALLLGAPWLVDGVLYNAALLLDKGEIAGVALKRDLPNYGVFDEKRVFACGPAPQALSFRGVALGVMVCEDMWTAHAALALKRAGAQLIVVLNASPYEQDKSGVRRALAQRRVQETGLALAYVNIVGGQDELVFDGRSFLLGGDGEEGPSLAPWQEALGIVRWRADRGRWDVLEMPESDLAGGLDGDVPEAGSLADIYCALVMGLRDYVNKNYFPGVIIGMSGGIDSALSAALAVDALGADRVHCVMMPSPYTSRDSLDDAAQAAALLGVAYDVISIEPAMTAFSGMLEKQRAPCAVVNTQGGDTTAENIQARARGVTLMALSNTFGHMVLSTGNKSEMSVGYATLYGDMCGGYSVLKDVYKTSVFALARWRNAHGNAIFKGPRGPVMPERIITKAPSAELKPDQTDQDTLPPYADLDDILSCLIEGDMSKDEIAARGHPLEMVKTVWRMVDRAEYKRRQAPPGVKISARAFGRDRRYPITNGFTA
ncbi:NAD+ synthase [Varunaivibrio sulfuroxidans]|uniref:Glutamine-dependent NAD(+) synthetase n=1 Tax=Varunaivibrio sulfuroxidans TaxID=1773489 RepID=A0A4R3J5L7_9PROT|nr:NAD+ synthase [Varunaivibrio sulfuroxidans]TCS60582.1 NH(3)-dependent NAD(+) synthetase [Varunaivibrio sulfuroxidans]WES30073.1 NAD+ synthase [Varunaivibrio sulfuroxidans]